MLARMLAPSFFFLFLFRAGSGWAGEGLSGTGLWVSCVCFVCFQHSGLFERGTEENKKTGTGGNDVVFLKLLIKKKSFCF